jgi:hypothetical protein
MLINNSRTSTSHIGWSMVMVYVAFLTCMAAVFTPIVDDSARFFAGFCFVVLGIVVCAHALDTENKKK